MTCESIKEHMTGYLLGDLDDVTAAAVCEHLNSCDGCRAFAQEIEPTLDLLRDALAAPFTAPERLPAGKRQNIFAEPNVNDERVSLLGWFGQPHPGFAVAAGFVVVVGVAVIVMVSRSKRYSKGDALYGVPLAMAPAEEVIEPSPTVDTSVNDQKLSVLGGAYRQYAPPAPRRPASEAVAKRTKIKTRVWNDEGRTLTGVEGNVRDNLDGVQDVTGKIDGDEANGERRFEQVAKPKPDVAIDDDISLGRLNDVRRSRRHVTPPADTTYGWEFENGAGEKEQRPEERMGLGDSIEDLYFGGSRLQAGLPDGASDAAGGGDAQVAASSVPAPGFDVAGLRKAGEDSLHRVASVSVPVRERPASWHSGTAESDDESDREISAITVTGGYLVDLDGPEPMDSNMEEYKEDIGALANKLEVKANAGEADAPSEVFYSRSSGVNPFQSVAEMPLSTFSIDVDTASYTLARNFMRQGQRPPPEAVRIEEFVNFFDYGYPSPSEETFAVHAQVAPSRFGRGLHLLKIGVKGRRVGREEQRPAVLTFLVDTSGSMDTPDRLGMVQRSLGMLVEALSPDDRVSLVQYDAGARLVLDQVPASEKKKLREAIYNLQCGGATNLEEGMAKAYAIAASRFVPGAENRVLILSDGAANLGEASADELLSQVANYRKQGIRSSVLGFGSGTYNDATLETLADKGDGSYVFIDSEEEARRVLVDDLAATLNTIAADVKIQVAFNPEVVRRIRQMGYENRQLADREFRDDSVDAGEVGSGQSVTALYELELSEPEKGDQPLATVRIRYRRTDTGEIEEIEHEVMTSDVAPRFEDTDSHFQLAACAAEFAEQLRQSPHATGTDLENVATALRPVALDLNLDSRVHELLRMVEGAKGMSRAPQTVSP